VAAFLNGCSKTCDQDGSCIYTNYLSAAMLDNGDSIPHEVINGTLYAKALELNIEVRDSAAKSNLCYHQISNSFITPAAAILKKCNDNIYKDYLDSFSISSDHDFDAMHPANTDLKELFYTSSKITDGHAALYTYYMRAAPADTGTHIFTIRMAFTNGKVLSVDLSPVKLLK
jgi:hypothetical protein